LPRDYRLLEVRLELLEKNPGQFDILYTPSIDPVNGPELRECVMGWTSKYTSNPQLLVISRCIF